MSSTDLQLNLAKLVFAALKTIHAGVLIGRLNREEKKCLPKKANDIAAPYRLPI